MRLTMQQALLNCFCSHACCLQEYVSLSFSPDGKLLLAQGGGPDWNLLLWTWEKSKVASSIRSTNLQGSPVVQVSLCLCWPDSRLGKAIPASGHAYGWQAQAAGQHKRNAV